MKKLLILVALALIAAPALSQNSLADPFEGNDFQNPNWQWHNEPANWDLGETKPGWLHMEGDVNRNLWAAFTPSTLYHEHSGDFDIETRMIMNYVSSSVVAGVVAHSPTTQDHNGRDGEWVTIKLWGRGAAEGDNAVIQYQAREFDGGEGFVATVPGFQEPHEIDIDLYMKLRREGSEFTAWYKRAAGDDWIDISVTDQDLEDPLQVGIYGGVADGAGEMVAQFEYVEDILTPLAVSPKAKLPVAWGALKKRVE